jgi:ankyrin repeat protein
VKVLKKGDVVWVQLEIIGSGGKWCLISEGTKKTSLGFVICEDLGYLDPNPSIPEQSMGKQEMGAPLVEGMGGLDPNASDTKGDIPSSVYLGSLLQAIWKGDIFAVKELVEEGVDPNAQTKLGKSPLHMAAKKEETEITSLLIAHGGNVNAGDQNGKTPLMEAASAGQSANAEILLSAGANINAVDENGFTALMWATMLGFPEFVGILLEAGAEVNARSKDGRTAMGICQKIVENTAKSLARAFKSNSGVSELRMKLEDHNKIFQMLKGAGGRE